jgi:cardiolipin synthase A/B
MRILKWVGLLLLGLVVALFALIGALHVFRGTPVTHVASVGGEGGAAGPASVADSARREAISLLTGLDLDPGNQVEILLNGNETFPRLWRDIRSARSSVTLRLYFVLPGAAAESLHVALVDRARAGVPVFFMYDSFGSDFRDGYIESLRAAGVRVAEFRPLRWYELARVQNRSHVRAVIVDGRVAYTGGFGIDDMWLGDGRHEEQWRDTNVRFEGPAVPQLQAVFLAGWAEATGELLTGPLFFPPRPAIAGTVLGAGVLFTSPTTGSTPAERFLALSIASAARTLYITNAYFVPDDDQRRLLVAAARRGVDVRVLTAGRKTDMPAARLAGRRRYAELLAAGVRIYEYQPTMIHAKTLAVDGVWTSLGTMNFDNRSTALNEESNLVVYDAGLGARVDSVFARDLRYSREITLPEFRRRGIASRALEIGASALVRML